MGPALVLLERTRPRNTVPACRGKAELLVYPVGAYVALILDLKNLLLLPKSLQSRVSTLRGYTDEEHATPSGHSRGYAALHSQQPNVGRLMSSSTAPSFSAHCCHKHHIHIYLNDNFLPSLPLRPSLPFRPARHRSQLRASSAHDRLPFMLGSAAYSSISRKYTSIRNGREIMEGHQKVIADLHRSEVAIWCGFDK
ncbi:hypothetical protein CF335_g1993 [Tilletia laevis]|nr:hypothetical protein CF335_g1993 [Tilletia laevis]